jgi:predicted alpha/beta-fold hydrolase
MELPMNHLKNSIEILNRLGVGEFQPAAFLKSGFLQTVAGAYWPQVRDSGSAEIIRIELGEGDATLVAVDQPREWKPADPVAFLIHGLSGDHLSSYMVRMVGKLMSRGYLCVRMNLRNAGLAFGLSKKTYHAGITPDVRVLVAWLKHRYPQSPLTAFGFSLGGNLLLKTAAEDGESFGFKKLVTVSPAVDLASASAKLNQVPGKWIAQIFLRQMIRDVVRLQEIYPDLEKLKVSRKMSIRDFDELHTSKYHGFRSADHYYETCSSSPFLHSIAVPTLIIGAIDDPVVDLQSLRNRELPQHIEVILTEHGGHVGFVGQAPNRRWADTVSLAWIK